MALAQSLPSMRALQTLFLRDAGVEEGGAIALSEALPQCGALTALDLSCNAVGDKGAIAIAQAALQEGGGLTSLSLASQCPKLARGPWRISSLLHCDVEISSVDYTLAISLSLFEGSRHVRERSIT